MLQSLRYDDKEQSMVTIIQQNNQDGFGILYDKYAPPLLGVIKRMIVNDTLSEVVFQKVFAELWRRKETYDTRKERLFTWMYRITRTITIDFIRSGNLGNSKIERLYNALYGVEVERFLLEKDTDSSYICCMHRTDKEILNDIYFKGNTISETAAQIGLQVDELMEKLETVIKSLKKIVTLNA